MILNASAENGALGSAPAVLGLAGLRVDPRHRRDIERRGQVVDHRIQHGCTPLFLNEAPQITGNTFMAIVPGADGGLQLLG